MPPTDLPGLPPPDAVRAAAPPSSVPSVGRPVAAAPAAPSPADPFDATVYAERLRPHRSLGPRGTALALGLAGAAGLVVSVPFVIAGAWPVLGFCGLDVLLLGLALRASFRQARAHEDLALTHARLVVRRVSARGAAREWRFDPLFVRLSREEDEEHGLRRLAVNQGRRTLEVGAFLDPDSRARVARALGAGLAEARRGPTYNP